MRKSIVLLLVLAGCAGKPARKPVFPALPPPLPTMTTRPRVFSPVPKSFIPSWFVPIQYPPDITPSNFCWRVQYSTNLATWQDWDACRYGEILVTNTEPAMFFRLIGTPQ